HSLNYLDHLFVPSKWAKEVALENGIKVPITVVNPATSVPPNFAPSTSSAKTYVFFTVGKWEKRKGHDTLIRCFGRAFKESDDVELHLFTHNPFLNEKEHNYWLPLVQNSPLSHKIKVRGWVDNI